MDSRVLEDVEEGGTQRLTGILVMWGGIRMDGTDRGVSWKGAEKAPF